MCLTIVAELYGVRVKGRLDHLDLGENLIVDVKKCQPGKSAVDAMERAILKYGYYRQLGFYQMLVRYITGSLPECRILFIEDDWPFGINCRRLNSRLLAIGRADCVRWLHRFKVCRDSGEWPDAYPESVTFETGSLKAIDGPGWLHDRYTDEDLFAVGGFDESERPDMVVWEG